jgi:hypothetical protein
MSRHVTSAYITNGSIQFLTESGTRHKLKHSMTNDKFVQVEQVGELWMGITDSGWAHWYNDNADLKKSKRI